MKRFLLGVMILLAPALCPAEGIPVIANVLDIPANPRVLSSYSLKKGALQGGLGYGVARILNTYTLSVTVIGSQRDSTVGTLISVPLVSPQGSFLAVIWPALADLEGGVNIGWGYSFVTDDNGNTSFTWGGLDYGVSLIKKF